MPKKPADYDPKRGWICHLPRKREKRPWTQAQIERLVCKKMSDGTIKSNFFVNLQTNGCGLDNFADVEILWQKLPDVQRRVFLRRAVSQSLDTLTGDADQKSILEMMLKDQRSHYAAHQSSACETAQLVNWFLENGSSATGVLAAIPAGLALMAAVAPWTSPWALPIAAWLGVFAATMGTLSTLAGGANGFIELVLMPVLGCKTGQIPDITPPDTGEITPPPGTEIPDIMF